MVKTSTRISVLDNPDNAKVMSRRLPCAVRAATAAEAATMLMLTIRNAIIALEAGPTYFLGKIDMSRPNFTAAAIDQSSEGTRNALSTACPTDSMPRELA